MTLQLSQGFKIHFIVVNEFNFKVVDRTNSGNKDEGISIELGIDAAYKKDGKNGNDYAVQLNAEINAMHSNSTVFQVEASIGSSITIHGDASNVPFRNIVAIMFSYLRPIVAQMTVMAKLPPLDLQPLNFMEFKVRNLDENNEEVEDAVQSEVENQEVK